VSKDDYFSFAAHDMIDPQDIGYSMIVKELKETKNLTIDGFRQKMPKPKGPHLG
jgi:hypothetical protein